MKRINIIIMTMLTALIALPAFARDFEYDGLTYTVLDESALTCQTKAGGYAEGKYVAGNAVTGEVVIPATVTDGTNSYSVVKIGDYGFAEASELTAITISEGIKTIGVNAFMWCTKLETVSLPNTLTSIEPYAFQCTAVRNISIPSSMTSIGDCVFFSCGSLYSIELPETITSIGAYAFYGCSSMPSIELPSGLKSVGDFAFRASGIQKIVFPESLETIGMGVFTSGSVYASSASLSSVTIPASVTSIGEFAFNSQIDVDVTYDATKPLNVSQSIFNEEVYNRSTLTMPNASLADIMATSPWNMFKKIVASDGSVTPLEESRDFEYNGMIYTVLDETAKTCKTKDGWYYDAKQADSEINITEIEIPAVVSDGTDNFTVTEIGSQSFGSCWTLTSITLPNTLKVINASAFSGCSALKSIELPESLTQICQYAFYESGLISITIPESVTFLGLQVFTGCKSLAEVHLPETMTAMGPDTFNGCENLTSINLPSSLTYIGIGVFASDFNLKSYELPSSLVVIDDLAMGSSNGEINFPESLKYLGVKSFWGCGVTNITLPASLTYIGREAFDRNEIKEIANNASKPTNAMADIFYIDPLSENIPEYYNAYEDATLNMPNATLAEVQSTLPWSYFKKVKAKDGSVGMPLEAGQDFEYEGLWYTVIDAEAKTCRTKSGVSTEDSASPGNNVEGDLVIPSKVSDGTYEYTVVEIGEDGFRGCNITSLTLPESVTSIAGAAFFNCEALSTITFSEGLQSIGEIAFNGCKGLTSLSLPTSVTAIGQWAFYYCENLSSVGLPASLTSIGEFTFHMCNNINIVEYQASTPITAPENLFTETVYNSATLNMPNATLETVQATVPWNLFKKIVAKDGTVEPGPEPEPGLGAGEDFEYEGLWYTVLDTEAMTCKTKEGVINEDMTSPGNSMQGDLVIPSKVSDGNNEYSVVEIGANGFRGSMISSVTLPETVTTIRAWAFSYCYYLSSVKLPSSLTSIEEYAFNMCKEISQVEYDAADPITVSMTIFEGNVYDTATLNMPNSTLKVVQSTVPWNMFNHIVASDGTVGFMPGEGETVEYRGLLYTILTVNEAEQTGTVSTKAGEGFGVPGNSIYGDVEIPGGFEVDDVYYEVKQIGEFGFAGSDYLTSITLPTAIENIGMDAFSGCPRLTSLVWQAHNQMPEEAIYSIGNPNLLVYVDSIQFAPATLDKNVVVMLNASQHFECEKLVLTPGYPFTPLYSFDAHNSSMTKSFKQKTPIDGCGGWETIVLPFDVTDIVTYDDRHLTSFISFNDPETQYPFWLCDANPEGEWNYAESIKAGVPYIISMPNNEKYRKRYRISGNVTFSNSETVRITPETTAPYSTTWASGRQFRSLWLPLNQEEAYNAMGLNVGISDLTDNEGVTLLPGSAFHIGIEPKPLEAYVTRIDAQMAHRVIGNQSGVLMMPDDSDLSITGAYGSIVIASGEDRTVDIYTPEGMLIRTVTVAAGEPCTVTDLTKGIYIVANRKIAVK